MNINRDEDPRFGVLAPLVPIGGPALFMDAMGLASRSSTPPTGEVGR